MRLIVHQRLDFAWYAVSWCLHISNRGLNSRAQQRILAGAGAYAQCTGRQKAFNDVRHSYDDRPQPPTEHPLVNFGHTGGGQYRSFQPHINDNGTLGRGLEDWQDGDKPDKHWDVEYAGLTMVPFVSATNAIGSSRDASSKQATNYLHDVV